MSDAERSAPDAERIARAGTTRADEGSKASPRDFWDPRVQTKYWLEALSQAMDAWMRSVAFLELMQQGLQTSIAAKRWQDGWSPPPVSPPSEVAVTNESSRPASRKSRNNIPRGSQGKGNKEP